ncbi:MAG: hypothetical protein Aurels2KO_52970 [Aureliella sp.]
MKSGQAENGGSSGEKTRLVLLYVIHFAVACLLATQMAPAVNESHYIPKARHVWDSSFAPNDFFLQSHDSHYLASWLAGVPATYLGFTTATWLGRFTSWLLFAIAWVHLMRSVRMPALLSPIVFASWHLVVQYGHWSGEWAMGGFEAKSIAYPFILLGIASVIRDRWRSAWIFLAIAVAWHPLAGGWAGMSVGIYWLCMPSLKTRIAQQWPAFLLAIAIGLIGVVPAALGLAGENLVGKVVASQVHVYFRLPHHLCPQSFPPTRHIAAGLSLLGFVVATVVYYMTKSARPDQQSSSYPARLFWIASISVGFAMVGLAIDLLLSKQYPSTASSLLRFYWFRWADVAVPLAGVTLFWLWVTSDSATTWYKATPVIVVVGVASVIHLQSVAEKKIPAADKLVTESVGPLPVASDRYLDWLAVCAWIKENTPTDSLWLTPKYQQSFKWHAQRAEVVCWKDVPQDNASVHEWYRRINDCEPRKTASGQLRGWTEEEIVQLAEKYEFEWILLDRTVQAKPVFEVCYPTFATSTSYIDNRSFAVCRLRPAVRAGFLKSMPATKQALPQRRDQ